MKNIPTKKQFLYNPIRSYTNLNPYTIMFVYPQYCNPYVIKGGYNDCNKWMKETGTPALVHVTFWKGGKSRVFYQLININPYVSIVKLKNYYLISSNEVAIKRVKRVPRKWIKELDDYC